MSLAAEKFAVLELSEQQEKPCQQTGCTKVDAPSNLARGVVGGS